MFTSNSRGRHQHSKLGGHTGFSNQELATMEIFAGLRKISTNKS
jgi:hypothetical protein